MKLLLTVTRRSEVETALDAGADLVDVKDPTRGSLGRPSIAFAGDVARRCAGRRPVSLALGDGPHDAGEVSRAVRRALPLRPSYLKLGLAGGAAGEALEAAAGTIADVAAIARLVAVTFADAGPGEAPSPEQAVRWAHRHGAEGVMLDTLDKDAGSTLDVLGRRRLERWAASARALGLRTALAGGLDDASIPRLAGLGLDVVGVRGGACAGGREGRLDPRRCRAVRRAVDAASPRSASGR